MKTRLKTSFSGCRLEAVGCRQRIVVPPVCSLQAPASSLRPVRAFTLVELLVVVAIVMLTVGALLPALGNFFDSARAPDAHNLISAHLAGARNYAVANNITTALVFVADDEPGGAWRTLMFLAEQEMDINIITPPDIGFKPVAGRETTHLPNNIVVSAVDDQDAGFPDRIVLLCFSPVGQLTVIAETNDNSLVDDIILPGGLSPIRQAGGLVSVTHLYLYDYTVSGNPEELYDLYINYYTGTVIE